MELLKCDTVVRYLSSTASSQDDGGMQDGEMEDDFS